MFRNTFSKFFELASVQIIANGSQKRKLFPYFSELYVELLDGEYLNRTIVFYIYCCKKLKFQFISIKRPYSIITQVYFKSYYSYTKLIISTKHVLKHIFKTKKQQEADSFKISVNMPYAPKKLKLRLISIFLQLLFHFIEFLALLYILF